MAICRVIFRIDFKANFDMMDQSGKILALVKNDIFAELGENFTQRQIIGKRKDTTGNKSCSLSVNPQTIVIAMESVDGWDFDGLYAERNFVVCLGIVTSICKKFNINVLLRCGYRIFQLSDLGSDYDAIKAAIQRWVTPDLNLAIKNTLGSIGDIGIAFDGQNEDDRSFHLNFGPYKPVEAPKYFVDFPDIFAIDNKSGIIFDTDIVERKFQLPTNLAKWCQVSSDRIQACTDSCLKLIN